MALYERMIREWIGKEVKGSSCGLNEHNAIIAWTEKGKPHKTSG